MGDTATTAAARSGGVAAWIQLVGAQRNNLSRSAGNDCLPISFPRTPRSRQYPERFSATKLPAVERQGVGHASRSKHSESRSVSVVPAPEPIHYVAAPRCGGSAHPAPATTAATSTPVGSTWSRTGLRPPSTQRGSPTRSRAEPGPAPPMPSEHARDRRWPRVRRCCCRSDAPATRRTQPLAVEREARPRRLVARARHAFRCSFHNWYAWRNAARRPGRANSGRGVRASGRRCRSRCRGTLDLADDVIVGDRAILYSLGRITIGPRTVVGQYAHLCAAPTTTRSGRPLLTPPITLGRRWIAADAFVGPGGRWGTAPSSPHAATVVADVPPTRSWAAIRKYIQPRIFDESTGTLTTSSNEPVSHPASSPFRDRPEGPRSRRDRRTHAIHSSRFSLDELHLPRRTGPVSSSRLPNIRYASARAVPAPS